jgi:hypothetical protein
MLLFKGGLAMEFFKKLGSGQTERQGAELSGFALPSCARIDPGIGDSLPDEAKDEATPAFSNPNLS